MGQILLALSLIFAILLSDRLVGSPQDDAVPGKVGFIDLSKVLNTHKGLREVEQQVNEFLKNGEAEVAKARDEIEKLKDSIMLYTQFSKEYVEQENEIETQELALKHLQKSIVLERDAKVGQALRQAYSDIEKAVAEYADAQQLAGVISFSPDIDQLKTDRPEDILKWVSMVDTVWHDDRLDISDAVITIINGK
jgi:Skp family chaperone for outer membrane proteins